MNSLSELYNTDFHAWALQTATLLRQHKFADLNIEELAEEIEDLGKKQRNEIENRLVILLAHLLKWQFQPAYRSTSWRSSIIEQRKRIARQIKSNLSVKPHIPNAIVDAYPDAVDLAARETLLNISCFPSTCSYSQAQILDYDFYP